MPLFFSRDKVYSCDKNTVMGLGAQTPPHHSIFLSEYTTLYRPRLLSGH